MIILIARDRAIAAISASFFRTFRTIPRLFLYMALYLAIRFLRFHVACTFNFAYSVDSILHDSFFITTLYVSSVCIQGVLISL